jgi:indole-3-glycerol phosphate synthase
MSVEPPSVLAAILASTRAELERRKRRSPQGELEARLAAEAANVDAGADGGGGERSRPRGFCAALTRPGIAVIAEFKRRSPSAGTLREAAEVAEVVDAYARGGASALSVLTEQASFSGSLEDLRAARERCELPVLRKDFIVDEYQLLEARLAGADAVLLIVAALGDEALARLHSAALTLELDVLVEVHDAQELDRALGVGASLIGINNRDLRDFSVDVTRTTLLRDAIPAGVAVVSESGIARAAQLRDLRERGVDAVLVGESLMRAADPARALRGLLAGQASSRDEGGAGVREESETAGLRSAP